jgi:hypothetical protein
MTSFDGKPSVSVYAVRTSTGNLPTLSPLARAGVGCDAGSWAANSPVETRSTRHEKIVAHAIQGRDRHLKQVIGSNVLSE